MMENREERLDRELGEAWDRLIAGEPADGARGHPPGEPTMRFLHAHDDASGPDPRFVRRLKEDLMRQATATASISDHGHPAAVLPSPNGVVRPNGSERARERAKTRSRWWGSLEFAAASLLILALVGTAYGGGGFANLGGFLPHGARDQVDRSKDVPMAGVDPGRTNLQPGPGPEGVPSLRWRTFAGANGGTPVLVGGSVYVPSAGGLTAFDAATGARRWRAEILGVVGDAAVADDIVYAGSTRNTESSGKGADEGFLHALDASTGAERWRTPTGGSGFSAPAIADGTVYIVGGKGSDNLFAIDAASGKEAWRIPVGSSACACAPFTPAVSGGLVYVGNDSGDLLAIDRVHGGLTWRAKAPRRANVHTPVVADGVVYVGSDEGDSGGGRGVFAFDAADGGLRWSSDIAALRAPALADGTLYATIRSGTGYAIVALAADSGKERWRAPLASRNAVAPSEGETRPHPGGPPTVAGGTVYVGAFNGYHADGDLLALDAASGDERWRVTLAGGVSESVTVSGGTIFASTGEGLLHALGSGGTVQAAPGATPANDLTDRPACTSTPDPDPMARVGGTPASVGAPSDRKGTRQTEAELPIGESVARGIVDGIEATVRGYAACSGVAVTATGELDASPLYGFFSDDYFRRARNSSNTSVPGEYAVTKWYVSPFDAFVARDARRLADGRIGAAFSPTSGVPAFVIFVPSPDGSWWLIDEIVLLMPSAGSVAASPVATP
ncbi:MAG: PQQ-binding-like beta-propeller repeat protein [Thermomicrobiales bacterium]